MKVAFCHLSDIHFLGEENKNPIIKKSKEMIKSISKTVDKDTAIFVLVSGDISYSGSKDEYIQALSFFSEIYLALSEYSNIKVYFLFVPGNHDCDFSDSRKNVVISSHRASVIKENSVELIDEICKIFSNCYSFINDFLPDYDGSILFKQKIIQIDEKKKIIFNLINTAWLSEIKEKAGTIYIPQNQFVDFNNTDIDLSVSIFHHPFEYMNQSGSYDFKKYITTNSDIIFVGHGHRGEEEEIKSRESNYYYYLGEVLQDNEDSTNSGFSIEILDLDKSIIEETLFKWDPKMRIYKSINKGKKKFSRNSSISSMQLKYNDTYIKFLISHEIEIQHKIMDNVTLDDLFIYPELRVFDEESKKDFIIIKSENIKKYILDNKNIIVTGDTYYGKTALAKKLCLDFHNLGYKPLMINGKEITGLKDFGELVKEKIKEQYKEDLLEKYNLLEKREKILIIDDFNESELNYSANQELLKSIRQKFGYVILFSNITYEVGVLIESIEKPDDNFVVCDIMEMGHYLRRKLIKKWYSLGREHNIAEEKLEQLSREAENAIDTLNGDGCVLPIIPPHLLIILQQLDVTILNENISNYGYLYEFLINRSLIKLVDKGIVKDADLINGLLIETSYYLFINHKKLLDERDLSQIEKLYNEDYDENISFTNYIESLIEVNIFKRINHEISFKYSYIYYYFIAKYLSNYLEHEYVLDHIKNMSNKLFNEEYGNIMIFLCHISKNTNIINSIVENSKIIFEDFELCDLSCQNTLLQQVDDAITEIEESIKLESGSVVEHNDSFALEKDKNQLQASKDDLSELYDETEDPQVNEVLKINKAFKTMEVMGQILKNYPGTLKGPIKRDLITNTYNLGMRTLTVIYKTIGEELEFYVDKIRNKLYKNIPDVKVESLITALKAKVMQRMSWLSLILTYGMIRKISFCISNEALLTTINRIRKEGSLSFRLVYTSIMLNNIGRLESEEVLSLNHNFTR